MPRPEPNTSARSLAVRSPRELSDSSRQARSVRSASPRWWQPPEGQSPDEVRAVIAAASCERDRLLLRVLWATGARISEVLALRPRDVRRDSLVLPNRKNPNETTKRVFLPGAELGLTGELLLWAKEQGVADDQPLFFSRKRGPDGARRALRRGPAGPADSRRAKSACLTEMGVHRARALLSRYGWVAADPWQEGE